MSEPKLISPMLDNFMMGDPISEHKGVRCCPAMDESNGNKYIVKIISSPATSTQLDAMLLSGAYDSKESALAYYEEIAQGIMDEVDTLKKLSDLEGFMAYDDSQLVPMDDGNGYDVYLLSTYKMSLAKFLKRNPITHLQALNLGLDLCAALTVSRRSGYIFANLKPENVYMTTDNGFRIGDLGFLKLDGLKFAALPDRYRSEYTAPEMVDAFASLNTTIDTYAAGLILYQAFNAGQLPAIGEDGTIPAPDYADYEMAAIILKACDPDPEKRWEDPEQMGHAIVDYMQKNGAHDVPIVPPVVEIPAEPEVTPAEEANAVEEQSAEAASVAVAEAVAEVAAEETIEEPEGAENDTVDESVVSEDAQSIVVEDETLPEENEIDTDGISDEVSAMISQVDDLVAHEVPEPVVAPEPIEIELPQEISENTAEEAQEETQCEETAETAEEETQEAVEAPVVNEDGEEIEESDAPKKKSHWLRYTILAVILLAILAGGFVFYKYFYIQTIDNVECIGTETELTIKIETSAKESLLTVVRTDTYGNKVEAPVNDGVAVFTLTPGTHYDFEIVIDGFHKLDGKTTFSYNTPEQNVIQTFTAQTSTTDGAVVLNFTVEGPAECAWSIQYVDDSGETITVSTTDNSATISNLTIGKEYLFTLVPSEDITFTGASELRYTAVKPIIAKDIYTGTVVDEALTVYWFTNVDAENVDWIVRCYNDNGYAKELNTKELTATFEGIVPGIYTIDIQAKGMPAAEPITVNTEAIEIKNIQVSTEDNRTVVTWECDTEFDSDWSVEYTVDSVVTNTIDGNGDPRIVLAALIPNARYKITVRNGENELIGNTAVVFAADAEFFDSYGLTNTDISMNLCVSPDEENWDSEDVESYTTAFTVGQRGSFILALASYPWRSWEDVVVQIVIRDDDGVVAFTTDEYSWSNMWSGTEGVFNLPSLPTTAGDYVATVYFNGTIAAEQNFTIEN